MMKLRREWGHAAGVRGRRASVTRQSENYFFPAKGGGGARKGGGRGPAVRGLSLLLRRKNGILILGCG